MNGLDWTIIILFIGSIVYSSIRGFVKEIFALFAIALGVWAGIHCSGPLGNVLSDMFNPNVAHVTAFLIVFIVVAGALTWLGLFFSRAIKMLALGWIDHLLGMVIGTLKVIVVVGVVLAIATRNSQYLPRVIENSLLSRPLLVIGRYLLNLIKK